MIRRVFIIGVLSICCLAVSAQYIPMRKGAVLEYDYRDAKGKPLRDRWRAERFLRFTVEEVWGDSVANVGVWNEAFERLATNAMMRPAVDGLCYGDVSVGAEGVVFENMQWLFTGIPVVFEDMSGELPEDEEDHPNFTVEVSSTSRLPRELHAGDSLPGERYELVFTEHLSEKEIASREESNVIMEEIMLSEYGEAWKAPVSLKNSLKAVTRNRYVEGMERVKTPAGEWDCWKISYEVVGPTEQIHGLPRRFQGEAVPNVIRYVDYMSPEVGLVRREKFNLAGRRVEEIMELEKIL